ncbi:prephenate dehydratase [Arcanobacterium bovis]|uniref:Prephenate dehydratase n=1 Tax=Arcanobacterium bovis TaxID=2529275 RepID=A0A4Q9V2K4_9ACTO|nr:prephenate dehydratase [Arcanobacterium bovis]TBW23866.1 prephenate dehydratase [Arcanobacterium bovis]
MDGVTTSAHAAATTSPTRFAFLGPRGTFCQQALNAIAPEDSNTTHIPAIDAPRAIKMVREGEADFAVVPIENSVEGGINATLDTLAQSADLIIGAEVLQQISFVLAVRPGTKLAGIKRLSTHNAAWTQCRNWLLTHLPDVVHLPATSTAAGAKGLTLPYDDAAYDATLVSPLAAQQYGLEVLSADVADNPDAVTRFVMIGAAGAVPPRTGSDKTTLMVQLPTDEAGALLTLLEQFAAHGVNLTRIESRPIGDSLGRYAFSIDAEGHIFDERIQSTLVALHRVSPKVTFLGSYPSAAGVKTKLLAGTADSDFHAARAWVKSLVSRSMPSADVE